jgi:hypothetical protein
MLATLAFACARASMWKKLTHLWAPIDREFWDCLPSLCGARGSAGSTESMTLIVSSSNNKCADVKHEHFTNQHVLCNPQLRSSATCWGWCRTC